MTTNVAVSAVLLQHQYHLSHAGCGDSIVLNERLNHVTDHQ